ncbi:TlpA family protein disulfide reductase [Chitinophaga lutea]
MTWKNATGQMNDSVFYVHGQILGAKPGDNIYLKKLADTIARGKIADDGRFSLSGVIKGTTDYYFISFDSTVSKKSTDAIWISADTMCINVRVDALPMVAVYGSDVQNDYLAAKFLVDSVRRLPFDTGTKIIKSFVREHVEALYIPHLLVNLQSIYKSAELDSLYASLPAASKKTRYGLELGNMVYGRRQLSSGLGTLPNFAYSDQAGERASALKVFGRSKYTLVDFWASWCAPCREHIPALKKAYNDFHGKGFNILSISIDKSHEDWRKACVELGTKWEHGIDDVANASKTSLGLVAVPAYFLVDSRGKVIHASFFSKYSTVSGKPLDVENGLYEVLLDLLK